MRALELSATILVAALAAPRVSAMFDVIISAGRASPPSSCAKGCALWSDLAGDGNTRNQADVNAKFFNGSAPSVRLCAMPANDPTPDCDGWCYCRESGDPSWGCCAQAPASQSVPEQINLQFVNDTAVAIAFATFDEYAKSSPSAQVSTDPKLAGAVIVAGVTNYWTQDGSTRAYSFHFALAAGLAPATTYYYRVSSGATGAVWSDIFSFTTRDPTQELVFTMAGTLRGTVLLLCVAACFYAIMQRAL